ERRLLWWPALHLAGSTPLRSARFPYRRAAERPSIARLRHPGGAAGIRLEAFDRALDGPAVVPAKERPEDRRQIPEQRAVGVHLPVPAHMGSAFDRNERPPAVAAEVARYLDFEAMRPILRDEPRSHLQ